MIKKLIEKLTTRKNFDYKQEILVKQGREQFKKLVERGTDLPVFLM